MKASGALSCAWKMQNKDLSTEVLLVVFIISLVLYNQHTASLRRQLPHLIAGKSLTPKYEIIDPLHTHPCPMPLANNQKHGFIAVKS